MSRSISITLTFTEDDISNMLGEGSDGPLFVGDLTEQQFDRFKQLMEDTRQVFVDEIVNRAEDEWEWLDRFVEEEFYDLDR